MTALTRPSVTKWPFFLGDACLLVLAWFIHWQARMPLEPFAIGAICACVATGAILGVLPFVLDYRLSAKLAESESLTTAVGQLQNLESIAQQIQLATGQWQTVQDHSSKAVTAATAIGEKMATEARAFGEFMQKANDTEKSNLRLEADKLRRSEAEWVQVVVRMLDHTYALHTAAVRSGKSGLIEQLTQFQNAQRDAARRVGLTAFTAESGETFDPAKHQSSGNETPADGSQIEATVATGFTFRGQLVRHALVTLSSQGEENAGEENTSESADAAEPASQQEEQTLL